MMAHLAARAGQGLAQLKQIFAAVQERSSLACRYNHRATQRADLAAAIEPVAEQGRLEMARLVQALDEAVFGLVLRYGIDLSQTQADELMAEIREVAAVTFRLERRQGAEIVALPPDLQREREHQAKINRLCDPYLPYARGLRLVGEEPREAA
ncbi:MAG: hypothetical protein ACE149_19800 [Armatimonadota bacterium]